ncbi:MAG: hypothetical protein ABIO16_18500 [Nocardioides sp.]
MAALALVTPAYAVTHAAATTQPALVYQSGGTVRVLTSDGTTLDVGTGVDGQPQHPDWSPDGERLAFETDFATLWSVAADGSSPRRLFDCRGRCVAVQDAAWSPDGTEIAFMAARTVDGVHTSAALLRVLDVASGSVRTVHADRTGRVWVFAPRWSDDGSSLVYEEDVFASNRLDESVVRRFRVVTIGVRGHGRRVLASWRGPFDGPGAPAPDRDGSRVVYVRHDNLVLRDLATGEVRRVTSYDASTEHAIQPTFTPDGRSVVFTHVTGTFGVDDRPRPAVIDLATGTVRDVGPAGATHPRLRP